MVKSAVDIMIDEFPKKFEDKDLQYRSNGKFKLNWGFVDKLLLVKVLSNQQKIMEKLEI